MSQNTEKALNLDTSEKILDAAEDLFIEHGFAATSMRAIAASAGVNLAATNYHFGSKRGLLAAVFQRRIKPINDERLKRLDDLIESKRQLTTRLIMQAFLMPVIEAFNDDRAPAVMGRLFGEPPTVVQPIVEVVFSEVANRYRDALAGVLPEVEESELHWRFHFTIGSMVHLLQFPAPLLHEASPETINHGMDSLIDFAVAGIEQPASGTRTEQPND